MNDLIYIGIDPGLSGALAIIEGDQVRLHDVPTRKATRGEEFLVGEMADLLRPYAERAFATIELVVPSYQRSSQGGGERKSSGNMNAAFKIGRGGGLWEMGCAALRIAYEIAPAATWKKTFRLEGCDKAASRARACELFPLIRADLAKKRPDYSEALLLAEYGRRRRTGELSR